MVTISEITISGNLVCLLLSTGEKIWLKKKDLLDLPLSEGDEWHEDEFRKTVSLLQYPRALNHAVSMLARRPCSTGEIRKRLSEKRYMPDIISLVIFKLEKEKLLDDREFCEQWIRYRLENKYGPRRILQELRHKGIPQEMAETVMESIESGSSLSQAVSLAEKAWRKEKQSTDIRKSRQKIIMQLIRRGYSWDDAKTACDQARHQMNI